MKFSAERKDLVLLFLVLLLAFSLRVYHLGTLSLWIDEAFTRFYSENSLSYLWTTGFRLDPNPPAYYTLMHFWMQVFGHSEWALRAPSVLASLLTIVLVYLLGKELANSAVGLFAALLMALAPMEIWYAQEARTYAALQCAIAIALLGMARYFSPSRSTADVVLYALGALVAASLHATAVLFIIACNLSYLASAFFDRSLMTRRNLVPWSIANLVVVLAITPVLDVMFQMAGAHNVRWIPPLSLGGLVWTMREVVGGPVANHAFGHGHFVIYVFLLSLAFLLLWLRKLNLRDIAILIFPPVFFIALVILLSLHESILIPRIFLWLWVPLSLLAAHTVVHGKSSGCYLLAVALVTLAFGLGPQLFSQHSPKENWREFLGDNRDQLTRADLIVLTQPISIGAVAYYMPGTTPHLAYWRQPNTPVTPGVDEILYRKKFNLPEISGKNILARIQSGEKVCLLVANSKLRSLNSSFANLPPAQYQVDEEYPGAYELHLLSWEGQ